MWKKVGTVFPLLLRNRIWGDTRQSVGKKAISEFQKLFLNEATRKTFIIK